MNARRRQLAALGGTVGAVVIAVALTGPALRRADPGTGADRVESRPSPARETRATEREAPMTGLDFPGSSAVATTMRFKFVDPHRNGLPIYGPDGRGVTYVWRAFPRRQSGYYTAFFWGNDDGRGTMDTFVWDDRRADTYYGAHPYPRLPPNGSVHDWEISIEQEDYVRGAVDYDRWHTQVLRVWSDARGKHHQFYWDFPKTDARHRVTRVSPPDWGNRNPPAPALTWGDAPWNPGNEVWNGVLRGIQIYATRLSLDDVRAEVASPLSTAAGAASVWYLNLDPTPDDITDKSGAGHDPMWVGPERPALFSDPAVDPDRADRGRRADP